MEKVTIYVSGGFGVSRVEAKLIEHGRKQYAQYDAAPYVHFVEKGKRTPKGYVQGSSPFILILKGHGHPEPDSGFVDDGSTELVRCRKSRYSSFDPRYKTDFNALINPYLAARPEIVVADYRHTTATAIEGGAA